MSERAVAGAESRCALCGADSPRRLFEARDRLHHLPGEFSVVRCRECSLVWTVPRLQGAALAMYYPDDYGPHASGDGEGPPGPPSGTPPAWKRLARRITSRRIWWTPELPPGARVLELGSGAGHFVRAALDRGWQVHALEPAGEPAARLAHDPRVHVHHASAESMTFPPGSFDAVFAWMVVEHLVDPRAVLRRIAGALRPGGYFVFSVPNAGSWELAVFRSHWYGLDVPRHLWHFSPRTLRRLCAESGFRVERVFHQKVLKNITGSLGLLGADRAGLARAADGLARSLSHPLVTFGLGTLFAALRQGGRLTVVARVR